MTLEQILEDIRSDRVKKVIFDSDTYNEMDDQYALAYAFGCKKIEILGLTAALFHNERSGSPAEGMEKSYHEIAHVLEVTGHNYPYFRGSPTPLDNLPELTYVDNPASDFIIKTAMEAEELIYVLVSGAITNIACAILKEPAIKDKICVVWIGGLCLDSGNCCEFNMQGDFRGAQIALNSGVPFVYLPAFGGKTGGGTVRFGAKMQHLKMLTGDDKISIFFRETLPKEFENPAYPYDTPQWLRILWDIGAPGVLSVPEAFTLSIIPAPILTDDRTYAFDSTRHKIIYMNMVDGNVVLNDAFSCIASLCE